MDSFKNNINAISYLTLQQIKNLEEKPLSSEAALVISNCKDVIEELLEQKNNDKETIKALINESDEGQDYV